MFMTEEQFIFLQRSRRRVPRYLFRAFSASSRGGIDLNSQFAILPDDANWTLSCNSGEAGTKKMIEEHLNWNPCHKTEFTSWSSSLLWVLRHAVRKMYACREPAEDISICMLDTSNYGIPVYPATAAYDAYGIIPREGARWRELERHYFFGEYLLRGGIYDYTSEFRVVAFADLEAEGLYELLPELAARDERERWDLARAVRDMRDCLSSPHLPPAQLRPLTSDKIRLARALGQRFGDPFVFPAAAAFLSLRRWGGVEFLQRKMDEVLDELEFWEMPESLGGEEDFGDVPALYDRYKPREAASFRALMQQLRNRKLEREIEQQAEREVLARLRSFTCCINQASVSDRPSKKPT
ncbi:putative glutathione s-transferase protein [Neofusicoccum parvum]|nr:putative glutathione s-transferase protein [Neofusicoccum parvum]